MELWKSSVIFLVLFSSKEVFSTSTNSTSPPISNNTTVINSNSTVSKELDKSDTNENNVQKPQLGTSIPQLNKTINQIKLDKTVNITTIGQHEKHINSTHLDTKSNGSNHIANEDFMDLQPTNASNFKYTLIPPGIMKSNGSKIDTEVADMLNVQSPSLDYDAAQAEPKIKYKANDPIDPQIILLDDSVNAILEGKKTEDNIGTKTDNLERVALVPGKLAAILAGVFLGIAIIGYVTLLSWRRYLENRYGNREMLVDDDYCEKQMNDLEHFSI